jgi:hypothetical protein
LNPKNEREETALDSQGCGGRPSILQEGEWSDALEEFTSGIQVDGSQMMVIGGLGRWRGIILGFLRRFLADAWVPIHHRSGGSPIFSPASATCNLEFPGTPSPWMPAVALTPRPCLMVLQQLPLT